jgi:Flp pilus assembly pilin Flp
LERERESKYAKEKKGSMSVMQWGWLTSARLRAWCERRTDRWSGQSTVEYALVGALVVIAAAGALTLLGGEVTNVFSRITNTLSGAASATR